MTRFQNIGRLILQLLLQIVLNQPLPAADTDPAPRVELPTLPVEGRLEWREENTADRSCFKLQVPSKGVWLLELRSTQPATHPGLLVLDANGISPRTLERVEGVMLQVCHPGVHRVCLTSAASLDDVELVSSFLKGGDPMETEVDPNPFASGCGGFTKGGDPMETEVDPNP